jgi:hypothetical protein
MPVLYYSLFTLLLFIMKNLTEKFEQLSEAEKTRIFKIFESLDKRTDAQRERERRQAEKIVAKENYRGFMNIFNVIKKSPSFPSLRTPKFNMFAITGTMPHGLFFKQLKNQGAYTFDDVWKLAENYQDANDGDKLLISERGEKVNALIMQLKNELSAPDVNAHERKLNAIENFQEICGAPFKVDKKGVRKCTLSESSAKLLYSEFPNVYRVWGLSEYLPKFHAKFIAISEEISADELETAK